MAKRTIVLLAAFALLVVACGGSGASTAPSVNAPTTAASVPAASHAATSPAASHAATTAPSEAASMTAESPGASATEIPAVTPAPTCNATAGQASTSGGSFDPSSVTGAANLGHWNSSPAENTAFACAVQGFNLTYPNVQLTNTTIGDPYVTNLITQFGAHNPPDVFWLNGENAIDWINQGFLLPLDDYIAQTGIDMSKFYAGYQ